ncbi:PREDICTED: mediator of RNA polymerase II transcription subunit 24-like [Priapulus caudatus]|uniref:Mediator of RNA polymerase II transcription subunit 24 n=1 Tax=Priapulus caudatus TaxID=37621 RepID=A0ABM1EPP3_PRICU|nr:PREDICTED: mediator of RNA polymerase II transcription subunit 24-like [Priapulus caudatus]
MDQSAKSGPANQIKPLLLQAWRERWSDVHWGIKIKKVLPKGVSGDAYSLAQCILEQGLIGPSPNRLMFSYLQMALSSQLVSYATVLQTIAKFSNFDKVHCVHGLLELLCTLPNRIYCEGNAEECMALCMSLLQVVSWTVICLHGSLLSLIDVKTSPEHSAALALACEFLGAVVGNEFTSALVRVGRAESPATWADVDGLVAEIAKQLAHQPTLAVDRDRVAAVVPSDGARGGAASRGRLLGVREAGAAGVVAEELPRPQLYCELFKACFQGIVDASSTNEELKWNAFTYIKLPHVLHRMHASPGGDAGDVAGALSRLLEYGPLLRLVDARCNCDCVQFLVNQLVKYELLTDAQGRIVMETKADKGLKPKHAEQSGTPSNPNAGLILRAEPTVSSILKTLDADYSKNQDALMSVLCQMLSGKSFELILAAAAATGQVRCFAVKLIKFNEFSKQVQGENQKASQARALLFDISFLMLCHICQLYGTEIVTEGAAAAAADSFFVLWATRCLPAGGGRYKSLETGIAADAGKVETLLQQLQAGGELKLSLVKWQEMCVNVPAAVQEVLVAWEAGAVTAETVKSILETVRGRMCCLSVCVSAWLCGRIHTSKHDDRLKPMNMINHLLLPAATAGAAAADQTNPNYNERHVLMTTIIRRMYHDLHPVSSMKVNPLVQMIPAKTPVTDCLLEIFHATHRKGWMELKSVHMLKHLLSRCRWYVDSLIKELLNVTRPDNLQMAARLVHAMFMLDIQGCTLCLVTHTVPNILVTASKLEQLTDPRDRPSPGSSSCASTPPSPSRPRRPARRRPQATFDGDAATDDEERPSKLPRCSGNHDLADDAPMGLVCDAEGAARGGGEAAAPLPLVVRARFVEEARRRGARARRRCCGALPSRSSPSRRCSCRRMFTPELILALCDASSRLGRKIATKILCQHQRHGALRHRHAARRRRPPAPQRRVEEDATAANGGRGVVVENWGVNCAPPAFALADHTRRTERRAMGLLATQRAGLRGDGGGAAAPLKSSTASER